MTDDLWMRLQASSGDMLRHIETQADWIKTQAARIAVLEARNAELEAVLQQIEYLDRPQIRGQPRRKTIQEIARAALKGKGNDPAT
jgi:cell division protein FtsB